MDEEEERQEMEDLVVRWLEERNRATLMGRFFDVSKDSGKQEFAEWFIGLVLEIEAFDKQTREV